MTKNQKPGRPPLAPPPGYMTLKAVAFALDVSYATVYRLRFSVPEITRDGAAGPWLIPKADIKKIQDALRQPPTGNKRAIQIRVDVSELERWETLIAEVTPEGEEPMRVGQWLANLASIALAEAGR